MRFTDALLSSPAEQDRVVLQELAPWTSETENQALLFVKPEITGLGPKAEAALELVEGVLNEWACSVDSVSLLGPAYLKRHRLIERHYGLINTYSTGGVAALPESGLAQAQEWLSSLGQDDVRLMGAHEYMSSDPAISADELLALQQTATNSSRLTAGAYVSLIDDGSGPLGIINGFHPAQVNHFYEADAPILVATVRTRSPWQSLRRDMIGATNPVNAQAGSLRRQFLERATALDLGAVDGMRNGLHLSAGPVEAAVEIVRYLGDHDGELEFDPVDTNFGSLVAEASGTEFLLRLLSNPEVRLGEQTGSVFDLTEEIDTREAVAALTRVAAG